RNGHIVTATRQVLQHLRKAKSGAEWRMGYCGIQARFSRIYYPEFLPERARKLIFKSAQCD
ncbi:MAG: hypothetical protein KGM99_15700, partial [Burkholderiales bacterium]|nr:hypothetical protein [Burkholderiales bacterium]